MRNPLPALARALGTRRWLMRAAPVVVWLDLRLHRLFGGKVSLVAVAGLPSLRLHTTGRRTGAPRATNLLYYPHGEDFVLTGSNWGKPKDPDWTFNLRAHPDAVVAIGGREIRVRATELKGDDYERMWHELLEFWPGYQMERDEAGRDLPIFRLSSADDRLYG